MSTHNLLIELFVEELPPKSLYKLGEAFASLLAEHLKAQGLAAADAAVTAFASPRRLAVHVGDVLMRAADRPVSNKLMPVSVGLDAAGNATPALLKRLAGLGLDATAVAQLKRAPDGKNDTLFYDSIAPGVMVAAGVQLALDHAMAKLPIPKVMSYQLADGWTSVNFVRPVHGLVALHGSDVVPIQVLGLNAGRATQGHRFEAGVNPVMLLSADSYAQQLREQGAVIASFAERRAEIARQLAAVAAQQGLQPIDDAALLDEVTALVERPNVLLGQFDAAFLAVPQECLILTMKVNQKYFPLLDKSARLTNQFLMVSNISPSDPGAVIGGNERVVRPRLADAQFFFDQDRKKSLASRLPDLDKVVYHNKLGSQGARVKRVQAIGNAIVSMLASDDLDVLGPDVQRAAALAKLDLLTDMVGEFPELQGVMGRYYAQHDGLGDDLAWAIEDHYKPRFAGDDLPRNRIGVVLALADKLETLIGLFGIGQLPTGDKDPYALRRHALGVIRLLMDKESTLPLDVLLANAITAYAGVFPSPQDKLADFIADRLQGVLREQGYSAQEIASVIALKPQDLADVPKRLAAVRAFAALPEAEALAAANKRIRNILKKTELLPGAVYIGLLQADAEHALYRAINQLAPVVEACAAQGDYTGALTALAGVRAQVDRFFDEVMVMAEDEAIRHNRLKLLASLSSLMNRVADISAFS
ncbi:MAG TPA: glycine--tRNA ligase subunit beta, partial [Betaproteobacteria bacterium]|nr:glycine--tRNA ligase subunit beta [Betaproteobacteria bacterium]